MFSSLGLFQNTQCPRQDSCKRPNCLFSHRKDLPPQPALEIPVEDTLPKRSISELSALVPAKREAPSLRRVSEPGSWTESNGEPPRKIQKVGPSKSPVARVSLPASTSANGTPILRVNAAQSLVPVPVRQTMLANLHIHFTGLYELISKENPALAAEHALKQEEEVYKQSSKVTYRNAVITCIAALKRRQKPTSVSHPSVGTEAEVAARKETKQAIASLRLRKSHIASCILTMDQLKTWGYFVEIPDGPGGTEPSKAGKVMSCERCGERFQVLPDPSKECLYHPGRAYTKQVGAERLRVYNCCGKTKGDGGCTQGVHVFYDKDPNDLHARHPFSFLKPPTPDSDALDIVALDCEMIYSTGGMSVARVSLVDGSGEVVYDEAVRMDSSVDVLDFNTKYSGITPESYATAILTLTSVRHSLDSLINTNTILIGHALENDLKTLRIIHHKCVDTAILYPHSAGPPYRKALRDLAREYLNTRIQAGGEAVGHSSVEDSRATLDLVRYYVLSKGQPRPKS